MGTIADSPGVVRTSCNNCGSSIVIAQTILNVKLGISPRLDLIDCPECGKALAKPEHSR